jgi:hypothetical protein
VDKGTIEVTARFSPFAFLYALVRARIEIVGTREVRGWGTHQVEVEPGSHIVRVSYPWLITPRAGENQVVVEVHAGETVRVEYTARLVRFVPGKMRVADRVAPARLLKG